MTKPTTLQQSFKLHYTALNRLEAECQIDVYKLASGRVVVVATDLGTGPSVTNNVEAIATELKRRGIHWDKFVEHYPDSAMRQRASYDLIKFHWRGNNAVEHVAWQPLTDAEFEHLIGVDPQGAKDIHIIRSGDSPHARGVTANVTHIPVHSPTGFEIGYGGSGPADLALAICEDYLQRTGYDGPRQRIGHAEFFQLAWMLHQDFKWMFLADPELASKRQYTITADQIRQWMEAFIPATLERDPSLRTEVTHDND